MRSKLHPQKLSKRSVKRDAIVSSATELFFRHGVRRATIDDIARAARVAKPTVYAHFTDKDALYVEVVRSTLENILEEARAAARAPALRDRIIGVLAAKFTRVFELLHLSPYASELLEHNNALAKSVIERADRAFLDLLEGVVRGGKKQLAGRAARPRLFAKRLLALGHGAGYAAKSAREHRKNLEALVDLILP